MLKFLRIICIWICCAFCLLERIQLPAATAAIAAPFEYFDDHDQLSYDLDTEQSKAKYDTRLLSEQMLKSEKSTERYESADSHSAGGGGIGENVVANSELDDDTETEADADVDDLQPHERAASCHNNGHKYTHGQKVPRIDPCEVCLCMDGEIFCWWELCAKKPTNQIKSDYRSNSQLDTSTARLNEMRSTSGTTAHPTVGMMQQQQQYQQSQSYATNLDVSSSKHDNNKNYQQQVQETPAATASIGGTKSLQHTTKSWQKKKTYQQQQKQKHEQQKQHQHKHTHTNGAAAENTPYYTYHPSSPVSASKILSFPENLPSVLYHDYRTEEHQHHQHQHHQQHLKHQQKKLQLQIQHQQEQQQKRKQQLQQYGHRSAWKSNTHQPTLYQHDIFEAKSVGASAYASSPSLEIQKQETILTNYTHYENHNTII
ncbi:myb-like protein Q [Rhagoletis pomonella]|uniref:myb-like protein Q n=1 Tax=Rhagoletis pomonella TaxID=28610 RepID=UPI00178269A5|nr:myb-like protein Q [Rhagoletis pomonella]